MHRIALKSAVVLAVAALGATPALADVWKWVDALGNTHFVDTQKSIYTWVADDGKVHFSDTPDDDDAVAVQLVWHSQGSLDDLEAGSAAVDGDDRLEGETAEEAEERRQAEAYYCQRATEIYESYVNAPDLFRTDDGGERVYLTKEEKASTLAETKAKVDELCS